MTEEEEKAVEFVKKRTKELKKYARREDETTYDDIVLNLVSRLLKENEELKILKDDIKDKRIVYVDTPEFEENYIQVSKIKEKIKKLKPYEDFFNGNDTNVGSI